MPDSSTDVSTVRDLVRRYFVLLSGGPLDDAVGLLAPAFTFRHPPLTPREGVSGRDAFLADVLAPTRTAFPDMAFTVHDVVVDASRACARWRMHATHREPYMGVAGSGRVAEVDGMNIFAIEDGRIAATWVQRDNVGLLRQLGCTLPF